jgi:hypothetical protein
MRLWVIVVNYAIKGAGLQLTSNACAGGYDEGQLATISVSREKAPATLLTEMIFVGWRGDASGVEESITLVISGPLLLEAVWEEKINLELSALLLLAAMIVVLSTFYVFSRSTSARRRTGGRTKIF